MRKFSDTMTQPVFVEYGPVFYSYRRVKPDSPVSNICIGDGCNINSAQVDRTSQTKGLLILNNGMSSLCRFQEKINFPPCIFKLSSNKYFHFPLFVGSRYFLIKEALTLGRTRKDIPHTTTRGGGGGGGRGWNPSREFLISCSISKRFYLRWKAFDLLNKIGYILWVVALLEACEVTNHGRYLGRHLGFYQEIEIRLKPREMVTFCALHENNP